MARNAPGLSPSELRRMTPEETRYARKRVEDDIDRDRKVAHIYVTALMKAAGARII